MPLASYGREPSQAEVSRNALVSARAQNYGVGAERAVCVAAVMQLVQGVAEYGRGGKDGRGAQPVERRSGFWR
jgi:hypothetical protein